jgi:hypothetical protein
MQQDIGHEAAPFGEAAGLQGDPRAPTCPRTVKRVGGVTVFAPLKTKARGVPVAAPVIPRLSEHVRLHPPLPVRRPWHEPGQSATGGQ